MTDKQIMIDVSKCKECGLRNCEGTLIYWCHTYDDHCADFNDCYYKQLKAKEQECERLKEANKHIEHNRTQKANKLKRIEEMIIACSSGYTDEFIQSILAIILEAEPIKE